MRSLVPVLATTIFVLGCVSDSGSIDQSDSGSIDQSDSGSINQPDTPQLIFDNSNSFMIRRAEPAFVDGFVPAQTADIGTPLLIGSPSKIEGSSDSQVQVELLYEVTSPLAYFFVSQENAVGYLQFDLFRGAVQNGAVSRVLVTIDMSSVDAGRCYDFSVSDRNLLVSSLAAICVESLSQNSIDGERKIFFTESTFSLNATLRTLSLDSGEITLVGETNHQITDIAFSGSSLFGVTSSFLIEIDPVTGASTDIGSLGLNSVNGLESYNGVLYATDGKARIYTVDPVTAETTQVGELATLGLTFNDLVADPTQNGILLGTAFVPPVQEAMLYSFDLETQETNIVGPTGFDLIPALAVFRDQLLGLTYDGKLISIDPATGVGTLIRSDLIFQAGGASASELF